jgi:hypothetical protein
MELRLESYKPEWEYLKSLVSSINLMWIESITVMGNGNELKKQMIFEKVMEQKPELINEYKHLLDTETLKKVIDKHPLTKLYLK